MAVRSLWGNVLLFVGSVLVVNGLIFGLGFAGPSNPPPPSSHLPPDWVIGAVWTVLFCGLGVARYALLRVNAGRDALLVTALAVFCLMYPFYTLGLRSARIGFIGNIATIVAALLIAGFCLRHSRAAAACSTAVAAWVTFATLAM